MSCLFGTWQPATQDFAYATPKESDILLAFYEKAAIVTILGLGFAGVKFWEKAAMQFRLLISALGCLLLAGCISGVPKQDTYTSSTGQTTVIQSDKEMCVQSCNDEYSRCMETDSAQDNGGVHAPAGMFGASADCHDDLKNCLPRCKSE